MRWKRELILLKLKKSLYHWSIINKISPRMYRCRTSMSPKLVVLSSITIYHKLMLLKVMARRDLMGSSTKVTSHLMVLKSIVAALIINSNHLSKILQWTKRLQSTRANSNCPTQWGWSPLRSQTSLVTLNHSKSILLHKTKNNELLTINSQIYYHSY